jgi:hypothetical protein
MKEQLIEGVQHAASGKVAMAVAVGAATSPKWIDLVMSPAGQASAVVLGLVVSISIVVVNVQSVAHRAKKMRQTIRQEKIRTALLEKQAEDKNITID